MEPSNPLNITGKTERARAVKKMFGRIARFYDRINRLMTLGMDRSWRKETLARLNLHDPHQILDIGCGSGDFSFESLKMWPDCMLVACDFTPEMIQVGMLRPGSSAISWVIADANNLPFAKNTFDGVVSGFLLRNTTDLPRTLREQLRTLKPGKPAAALDTTPPSGWTKPLVEFYLRKVIPLIGRLISGDAAAYTYLPASTEAFLNASQVQDKMVQAGFEGCNTLLRNFSTIAIHQGCKPPLTSHKYAQGQ